MQFVPEVAYSLRQYIAEGNNFMNDNLDLN